MGLQIIHTVEPVSLAEAKVHLNVTSAHDDEYITRLIAAARVRAEGYTRRAFATQNVELTLDAFEPVIILPRPPVQAVTSINFVDENGATQAFTDYQSDLSQSAMARVKPAYGNDWPATRDQFNAVTINYVAGYGGGDSPDTIGNVPDDIFHALLLMIGTLYEHREDVIVGTVANEMPMAARHLLDPYRVALV